MARVIAIDRGHDGSDVREVGEEFDVADERLKDGSTWFVEVGKAPKPVPAPKHSRPLGAGPLPGSKAKD